MAATVYLSEYHTSFTQIAPNPRAPPKRVQTPILASATAQSFQPFTSDYVRLAVDGGGGVSVRWGSPPQTAMLGDEYWGPNSFDFRVVSPGDTVSVIISGSATPPPPATGFLHGGQYMVAPLSRQVIRFGQSYGMQM